MPIKDVVESVMRSVQEKQSTPTKQFKQQQTTMTGKLDKSVNPFGKLAGTVDGKRTGGGSHVDLKRKNELNPKYKKDYKNLMESLGFDSDSDDCGDFGNGMYFGNGMCIYSPDFLDSLQHSLNAVEETETEEEKKARAERVEKLKRNFAMAHNRMKAAIKYM